jgi:undecaprenyl-diphosphatase
MTALQALVIAVLQGATELFPVSSLGHAVILPKLLGWQFDQKSAAFLPFLVMLHLGTAAALLAYFWRDWWLLAAGTVGALDRHRNIESRRILLLLIVATIPAGLLGFALEHKLRALFGAPLYAALFLAANGLLLLFGERLRTGMSRATPAGEHRAIASLTVADALVVGIWQCLALLPGISRSGATIVGGLLRGIDHEASAHFSFLIATPIILAASLKEVPKLLHGAAGAGSLQLSAIAAVVAGIAAFASTAFLMRYFRDHDKWALNPFAYYCLVAGGLSAAYFLYV